MVQKLSNKVVDLEKDKEASSSRKPFREFFKKKEENSSPQPPTNNSSVLNLTEVGMDNLCTFHPKNCPQWINSMNLVMNKLLEVQLTELESKEEKEFETKKTSEETTMVLWEWMTTLGLDEEETTDEYRFR